VIDLFSRQVVGWSIDDHLRTSLCISALQMAFWRRKPEPGVLHHSDRGSQYASQEYPLYMTKNQIIAELLLFTGYGEIGHNSEINFLINFFD
jgi:hypothetical protein